MNKLLLSAAMAGMVAAPQAANAAATAFANLFSDSVVTTFTSEVTQTTDGLLTSSNSANSLPPAAGVNVADSNGVPGTADAEAAVDGNAIGDSEATAGDVSSFDVRAEGAPGIDITNIALGEVTAVFDFNNTTPGLGITIVADLTRVFELSTEFTGDIASGTTSFTAEIVGADGTLLPEITITDPNCDPNVSFSVAQRQRPQRHVHGDLDRDLLGDSGWRLHADGQRFGGDRCHLG